jgi:hypothetical protein
MSQKNYIDRDTVCESPLKEINFRNNDNKTRTSNQSSAGTSNLNAYKLSTHN